MDEKVRYPFSILRKYPMIVVCLFLGLVVFALSGCAIANRFYVPPELEDAAVNRAGAADVTSVDELKVVTWNVGYAGLGKESDFIFDLGEQRRPLSAALVTKNIDGISRQLEALDMDIFLLQEVAEPSWSTYGIDVLAAVRRALPNYDWTFGADVNTRFVPKPWNIQVGNAVFSRIRPSRAERRGLPLEPDFQLGVFRKGYRMHIIGIDAERSWVIINIHLSTFDSEEEDVRGKQVAELLAFAQKEFQSGNHVVIGGDWNLRLAENEFPNTTDERYKFWIRDFPEDVVPKGWSWAVDATTATVRTAYKPYVEGENYILTIDGFLVSPNVSVIDVAGIDLNFEHSDHNPVQAKFRAK